MNATSCDFVFSLNNKWIKPSTYYDRWIKYRDYNQISQSSPYELRHTFISMIKALPDSVIKPLVGHSIKMDTYRVYCHEMDGEKEAAAHMVQQEFGKTFSVPMHLLG